MQKRRAGGIVTLVLVALAGVALVRSAATGRLTTLSRTLEPVASSASSLAASAWSALAPPSPDASPSSTPVAASDAVDAPAPVHKQTAPLSSAQLGAPLVHGKFLGACGAPDDMKVVVNVTVKTGRATHVAVTTQPPDPAVAACIERATHDLRWDISPKAEKVTVTY